MHKDMASVSSLEAKLNMSHNALLRQWLPHILVHILPLFAIGKSASVPCDAAMKKKVNHASQCFERVQEAVKEEVRIPEWNRDHIRCNGTCTCHWFRKVHM